MATKLIMKRKRHEELHTVAAENLSKTPTNEFDEISDFRQKRNKLENTTTTATTMPTLGENANEQQQQEPLQLSNHLSSSIEAEAAATATVQTATHNHILLEALQKIIELQNELDAFEHDLDESSYNDDAEVSFYLNDADEHQQQQQEQEEEEEQQQPLGHDEVEQYRRQEAEALGFAMCARETLLFLQREGIPSDSIIYRSLHQRLVGQSDDVIPI